MVTARGWWDLADSATFYPDDLPEDWRLTYFANGFRATLLPSALWSASEPSQMAQWREEVPAGFRFVAEQPRARPTQPEAPLQAAILEQLLEPKLAAWLEPLASAPRVPASGAAPAVDAWFRYRSPGVGSDETRTASERYAVQAPRALHQDLRGAKHWLSTLTERHGRAPSLIILAQPSSASLAAWQELLDLLGLSRR